MNLLLLSLSASIPFLFQEADAGVITYDFPWEPPVSKV
jgi:hypothetical protein